MKIVFCSEPFAPARPDYAYETEAAAAASAGFACELFSFEDLIDDRAAAALKRIKPPEHPTPAVYRGWMLKPAQYETLYRELAARNLILVNSPEEYRHCHYFPESYELIKDCTPASVFLPYDQSFSREKLRALLAPFGDRPLILKDYVKSRKHEWAEACFIPSAADAAAVDKTVARFVELQGDDLNEGLVFREFVEFAPLAAHPKSGMPLVREYRLFYFEGALLQAAEYWEEGEYGAAALPLDFFAPIARRVRSNFFTMDVAQTKDGEWLIVELGDGQVAGLPERMSADDFYESLKRAAGNRAGGAD